jgi:[protein-PII] uridylyltransferase
LWNGFKDSLLGQLYHKTMDLLSGATEFRRAEAKQLEQLARDVLPHLDDSISSEESRVHFTALPKRYFQTHTAEEIAADIGQAHAFMAQQLRDDSVAALEPVIAWRNEPDRGYTRATICTWDRAGLFSTISGAFGATGINILGAQVFTRKDNIVLDTFFVTAAQTGGLVSREDRDRFESLLLKTLTKGNVDLAALIARRIPARPLYQSLDGEVIPLRIEFDNHASDERTVIEIESEDRLGFLYTVSTILTDLGLNISLAKILTEKGGAIDSFYVSDADGKKITNPQRQHEIEVQLRKMADAGRIALRQGS